MQDHRDDRDP